MNKVYKVRYWNNLKIKEIYVEALTRDLAIRKSINELGIKKESLIQIQERKEGTK